MVSRSLHGLSLCAGGGGLNLGLMVAEPGFHTRAFVEWEDWPRAVLIAAQRAGYFAPAPIWDDLRSFDARPFHGAFDIVLARYLCQPFSAAGKRASANDPRHLWPDIARVITECRPEWVFLENVAGYVTLVSTGASMANAGGAELEGIKRGQCHPGRWQVSDGYPALSGGTGLHPFGLGDDAGWATTLVSRHNLAPALGFDDCLAWARCIEADHERPITTAAEPALRRMVDGQARWARALRLLGNGVHPLAAAHAWRCLAAAHGLRAVDLATKPIAGRPRADGYL